MEIKDLNGAVIATVANSLIEAIQKLVKEKTYLYGAYLYGSNLGGANLYGANLGGSNLGGANLCGANLGGSNLGGAYLGGANLGGSNLGGANLYGANLGGSNLGGSNLCGANLGGSNLGGSNLCGARNIFQSHAILSEILFRAADGNSDQEQLAAWIARRTDLCWDKFLEMEHPEKRWALDELAKWVTPDDNAPEILRRGR